MFQQLYIYAGPDRLFFRYVGDVEEIVDFPECYPGSIWAILLSDKPLPQPFVVVDIPLIRYRKQRGKNRVPIIEIFLAPLQDQWRYGPPEFPFLRAA